MKKKTKNVDRMIKELEAWVNKTRNREFLLDMPTQELAQYVNGKKDSAAALFSQVARWLGQTGANAVIHGDTSGWAKIEASFLYNAWNERILFAMLDTKIATSVQIVRAIFVLLHAISFRHDDIAKYFGNRLIAALQGKDNRLTGWDTVPLYPFAIHLFARWQQCSLSYDESEVCPLGIYKGVFKSWENDGEFGNYLVSACDYHIEQAFDDSDEDTQDFCVLLYNIFPVEILAIKRIREEQGLTMPTIDHRLMQTALATPPTELPITEDDLLTNVTAKVCEQFSIVDPWKW